MSASTASPKITWASLAPQLPKTIVFPTKNKKPLNTPGLNKNNPMWGKFNPTLLTRGFAKNFSLRKTRKEGGRRKTKTRTRKVRKIRKVRKVKVKRGGGLDVPDGALVNVRNSKDPMSPFYLIEKELAEKDFIEASHY